MPYTTNATIRAKINRWRDDPEGEDSISAQMARRLWAGETVSPGRLAREFGCSASLPGVVVRDMRQVGWLITGEPDPDLPHTNAKVYRLTGQGPELPEDVRPRPKVTVTTRRRAPSRITPTVLPPMRVAATSPPAAQYPPLGGILTVRALAMIGDDVVIHLRDGNGGAWQAVISGYVEGGDANS